MSNQPKNVNPTPEKTYYIPGHPNTPVFHDFFVEFMRPYRKRRKQLERDGLCNPAYGFVCTCDCVGCRYAVTRNFVSTAVLDPKGGRKHPEQEYIQMDTKNILFICGGAFAGIENLINERTDERNIGFGAKIINIEKPEESTTILKKILPEDLVKFGLIPEFTGRLPVTVVLDPLDKETLINVLKEPKNALIKQYQYLVSI